MQEFDLSYDILSDILNNKTPFNEALRKVFQTHVELRPLRSSVANLVGCELRHHHLFTYLLKEENLDASEKLYCYIAMANNFFSRRFKEEEMLNALGEKLGDEKLESVKKILVSTGEEKSRIPESVSRSSNLYLSLRYNTPDWVLKVLEHFGFGATYKTLSKLSHPSPKTYHVCTSLTNVDAILKDPEFQKSSMDGLVSYVGKSRLNKKGVYQEGKIFEERPFSRNLIASFPIEAPKQITIYNGTPSPELALDLIETYGEKIGLNIAVDNTDDYVAITKMIKKKDLRNVNFFSSPAASTLESAISCKQDLVIVAPNSTNFDDIPSTPDYLLRFDKSTMDTTIANEGSSLEEASKFVEINGKLVYVIYTISKKEGHLMVLNFLHNHPEFALDSEKQYFPYEELGACAYLAVMTRKSETPAK